MILLHYLRRKRGRVKRTRTILTMGKNLTNQVKKVSVLKFFQYMRRKKRGAKRRWQRWRKMLIQTNPMIAKLVRNQNIWHLKIR
jgi:hypothetical protein